MRLDQAGDLRVNFIPLLVRADGRKRRRGNLDRDVHRPAMADIHQLAIAPDADQEPRHFAQRLLRRRESDPLERPGQRLQPFQRQAPGAILRLSRARA